MKKIGFIDYFLDEWHANNYPALIDKFSEGEMKVCYAYAHTAAPEWAISNEAWAEKTGIMLLGSIRAVKKHNCFVKTDDSTIKKLSELILDEFYHWDASSERMVSNYLMQVLVTLERMLDGGFTGIKSRVVEKRPACFTVYQVVRYIDREYQNIPNVKSIADKLSYSEYYLAHLFKQKTGITIRDYLIEKKITYACELLKTTRMSMGGIAEQLNFASAHCFRRVFKQQIGMSPSDYKKAESIL